MAQLQQRVFMIFVRHYQNNSAGTPTRVLGNATGFWDETLTTNKGVQMKPLNQLTGSIATAMGNMTGASLDSNNSRPFNENEKFTKDIWSLHSVWTSFDEMKKNIRPIINEIGLNNVMATSYINLDLELTPNK